MSWALAYLIAISDSIAIALAVTATILVIALGVYALALFLENGTIPISHKKRLYKLLIFTIILAIFATIFPTKRVLLTTAIVKYGVEFAQTEQASRTSRNILNSVEKATKLLNQKLDQLLQERKETGLELFLQLVNQTTNPSKSTGGEKHERKNLSNKH
ncbi:MAG: hypothetical protein DRO05_00870 [Thermoproteota archaeon]|nr:MAG: hypothetical protein DRO05_00870 [Candidatus Korarchaeota archaeon]